MQIVVRIALIVTLVLGLTGCYSIVAMPDVATASVYGPRIPIRSLSPQQVARLSTWMKAHDAGWRALMETPPVVITMRLVLREPNGQQIHFDLFMSTHGTATMYFYAQSPAPPLKRYLSEADVATLWESLRN